MSLPDGGVGRRAVLGAGVSQIVGAATVVSGAARPVKPKIRVLDDLQIGVSCHYGMYGESTSTFEALVATGVRSFRDEAYWDHVEKEPGHLVIPRHVSRWHDLGRQHGMAPLLVLSYGHPRYQGGQNPTSALAIGAFSNYAAFVADRLRGVEQFQIWNEWELKSRSRQGGSARDYIALATSVAEAVRAVRPQAKLLSAGVHRAGLFNGYLEALVRGGLLGVVDGLAVHTYRFDQSDPSPEAWFAELLALRRKLAVWDRARGATCGLYVTEMGCPSHTGRYGVAQERQADYLERCLLLGLLVPGLKGFWWYGLRDKGILPWDSEHHYGLLDFGGQIKPAGQRLTELMGRLRDVIEVRMLEAAPGQWALRLGAERGGWEVRWKVCQADDASRCGRRPEWSLL